MTKKFKKDNLRKAFDRCLDRLDRDSALIASETSAGFLKTIGGEFQVFVRVSEFDGNLLKSNPDTGGLLENMLPIKKKKRQK